jgi:hypothetical protein
LELRYCHRIAVGAVQRADAVGHFPTKTHGGMTVIGTHRGKRIDSPAAIL